MSKSKERMKSATKMGLSVVVAALGTIVFIGQASAGYSSYNGPASGSGPCGTSNGTSHECDDYMCIDSSYACASSCMLYFGGSGVLKAIASCRDNSPGC